ncbi:MAG TPA: sulfite exporter TauE/SafE family protein [Candidatus Hydrogenedentes bacterium]|nr:sulfite exporter TauE/SafE family protein [Candidatus Hydrogenedentota bacterium]
METVLLWLGTLALGWAVGVISASLGIGGGILMVPALAIFAGMDPHTAKGTSLFIIMFVAALNSWRLNRRERDKPWGLAGVCACGSMVGAYAGVWFTGLLPGVLVTWIFIALVVFIAFQVLFLKATRVDEGQARRRNRVAALTGLSAGLVAGATGIGGGAVFVPLALLTRAASNRRVVALSNTVMVVTCAAGAAGHLAARKIMNMPWTVGQVNLVVAIPIVLGAQLGARLGIWLNDRLTLPRRKVAMAAILLVIAAAMACRAIG